jgi:hypothetical protein
MPVARALLESETAALRRVWASPSKRFWLTRHAREEAAKDDILESDVRYVIGRNGVSWVEWKQDQLWHVEGADLDGRSIRVVLTVCQPDLSVKIVTVMAL